MTIANAKEITKIDTKELARAFDNDLDLVLFFLTWIKNGKNATKAYQEMHPGLDYGSAATLGSRMLKKVDIQAVLDVYGLGLESYMQQLADGLTAERSDMTGQVFPDHKTRKAYHETLGKLLGVEKEGGINIDKMIVIPILGGKTKE